MSRLSVPPTRRRADHAPAEEVRPERRPGPVGELAGRLRIYLGPKLLLAVVLNLWVCVPYYTLQRLVFFPVTPMAETTLDRALPFVPGAAWVYVSLFVALPVPPLLLTDRRDLGRYCAGLVLVSVISDFFFLCTPTGVARPPGQAWDVAYRLVLATDVPLNACPSLHASLAVFTALWCDRLAGSFAHPRRWRMAAWSWTVAVLLSTLLTRQHVLLDLVAGAALALGVFVLVGLVPERRLPWQKAC